MNYLELPKVQGSSSVGGSSRLTDWKNEPRAEDLIYDITQALPTHNAQVTKINEWIKLLSAETDKTKIRKGRSGITPKVIRRLAEWRYGSLSTAFLNERKLFQVNATSPKYLSAAIQNELVLNFQFNALMNKVKVINDLIRAAVNEGTAIVRIGWETEFQTKEEQIPVYYHIQADPAKAMELASINEQIAAETQEQQLQSSEESETFKNLPDEIKESIKASVQYGMPVMAMPTGQMQTVKKQIQTKNRPSIKVIPNSSLIIDPSCEGDFEQARFAVYAFTTSYSELKASGLYKNLDRILETPEFTSLGSNVLGMDDATFMNSGSEEARGFNFKDKPRKRLQAYEYWGYYDIDGTGIVQAIVATIVNGHLIRLERSPFPDNKLPFVVIPYLPIKGSVYGEPDGELVKDNQEIIQALTRSMVDIQARSANGQIAIPKGFLDTVNAKKYQSGEDYQYNPVTQHPADAIYMHTAPEVPQSIMLLLQQQYAEAEASTGVKSFQGGIDGNAYGQVVQGMSQAITAMTQRESEILFRLSRGLEEIGNKIIAMNQEWLAEEEVIAVTQSEFIPIKRSDLAGDFFLNVSIKSNSEAEGKAQQLTFVAQTLGGDADWELRKLFILEICRLYNLESMASAISEYEPQPDPMQQQMMQLEMAELEAKVNKLHAEAEYFRSKGTFVEAQVDDVQADTDQKALDFLEQQSGITHQRNKEVVEAQAHAQNQGKLAQEYLKGQANLAVAKERNKAKPTSSGSSPKTKTRIDRASGNITLRTPSPRVGLPVHKLKKGKK